MLVEEKPLETNRFFQLFFPLLTAELAEEAAASLLSSQMMKAVFSFLSVDQLLMEKAAETMVLCGRWHHLDALPPGPMTLLKITTLHLAAECV